ncbi:MAG: zinc ribbon domain-containing protein [Halobacteriaceae archaeon]
MGILERLRGLLGRSDGSGPGQAGGQFGYECLNCHNNFTSDQRKASAECPECGSENLRGGTPTSSEFSMHNPGDTP